MVVGATLSICPYYFAVFFTNFLQFTYQLVVHSTLSQLAHNILFSSILRYLCPFLVILLNAMVILRVSQRISTSAKLLFHIPLFSFVHSFHILFLFPIKQTIDHGNFIIRMCFTVFSKLGQLPLCYDNLWLFMYPNGYFFFYPRSFIPTHDLAFNSFSFLKNDIK